MQEVNKLGRLPVDACCAMGGSASSVDAKALTAANLERLTRTQAATHTRCAAKVVRNARGSARGVE